MGRKPPLHLPQATINAILRNGFQNFKPLFKLVHYEYNKKCGDLHVFFQKCPTIRQCGDWKWARLLECVLVVWAGYLLQALIE